MSCYLATREEAEAVSTRPEHYDCLESALYEHASDCAPFVGFLRSLDESAGEDVGEPYGLDHEGLVSAVVRTGLALNVLREELVEYCWRRVQHEQAREILGRAEYDAIVQRWPIVPRSAVETTTARRDRFAREHVAWARQTAQSARVA